MSSAVVCRQFDLNDVIGRSDSRTRNSLRLSSLWIGRIDDVDVLNGGPVTSFAPLSADCRIVRVSLDKVNSAVNKDIYQVLGLLNVLINMDEENYETSKLAIVELKFNESDEKLTILAQNIMKAVQIRQRNQKLYSNLITYIEEEHEYDKMDQAVFIVIMSSMYVSDTLHQQLVYIQLLRVCLDTGSPHAGGVRRTDGRLPVLCQHVPQVGAHNLILLRGRRR